MKKNLTSIVLVFCAFFVWSQEEEGIEQFIPTSSPEAKSFTEVNFLPISEYTGKINVKIPLYQIDMNGLSIPISLKYNYGGVKVNSVSSNVGINWSLSYGGSTIREQNGSKMIIDNNQVATFNPLISNSEYTQRQVYPDLYHVKAPGLITSFVPFKVADFDYDQGKEIENQGNKIDLDISAYTLDYHQVRQIDNIKILSTNGIQYQFGNINKTKTKTRSIQVGEDGTLLSGHRLNEWMIRNDHRTSYDITEIKNTITNEKVDFEYEYESNDFDFGYIPDEIYANYYIRTNVFRRNGTLKTVNQTFVADHKERIKRISFTEGTVEFFYNYSRNDIYKRGLLDANNAAALSRIVVKNSRDQVVKDIRFEYSTVQSAENCTDYECYRLFLDRVYYVGNDGVSILPGYEFEYNSTQLPKRYSYKQDFLGFYNGAVASSSTPSPVPEDENLYVPITYQRPNTGQNSYLPFDIGDSSYQYIEGDYSLAANEVYAKAGMLEKLTYPTGGYTIFESESNQFNHNGRVINGGGLRIKSQRIYDHDNSLQKQINYDYSLENGNTSGLITYIPRFNDYVISNNHDGKGFGIYQTDMANQKTTQASYIGYSRVKIYESGNGHIIKEFSNLNTYPNILATWELDINGGYVDPDIYIPNDIIDEAIANGCFPKMVTDRDILRGSVTKETIFSEDGNKVKEVENTYEYKEFENYTVYGGHPFWSDTSGDNNPVAWLNEEASFLIERNLLKTQTTSNYYVNATELSMFKEFNYEDDYPFTKQKRIIDSDRSDLVTYYYYPFNTPEFDERSVTLGQKCDGNLDIALPLEELVNRNILSNPYYQESYKNDKNGNNLIQSKLNVFKKVPKLDFYGNPTELFMFDNTPMPYSSIVHTDRILIPVNQNDNSVYNCDYTRDQTEYIIHQYDEEGNPIDLSSNHNSPHTILVWGYQGKHLIAKIENARYSDLPNPNIWQAISKSEQDNDRTIGLTGNEGLLRAELNKLRDPSFAPNLVNALITTYTYDPLIGVTSVTDSKGETTYYDYDEFNRLKFIKNEDGFVITENKYNYKN